MREEEKKQNFIIKFRDVSFYFDTRKSKNINASNFVFLIFCGTAADDDIICKMINLL